MRKTFDEVSKEMVNKLQYLEKQQTEKKLIETYSTVYEWHQTVIVGSSESKQLSTEYGALQGSNLPSILFINFGDVCEYTDGMCTREATSNNYKCKLIVT